MTRVYYKEAVAAIIVFDVTRVATFEAVQKWKKDIDDKARTSDAMGVFTPRRSRIWRARTSPWC